MFPNDYINSHHVDTERNTRQKKFNPQSARLISAMAGRYYLLLFCGKNIVYPFLSYVFYTRDINAASPA